MKNIHYIFILLFVSFISHFYWFLPNSILSSGDWYYWPLESLKQLYFSWGTWTSFIGFGNINVQIPFNFFMSFWSVMAGLNFGYDVVSKVTFFIPIAVLGFISPYVLAKKLTKDSFIAFIVAMFYGTTTVGLINQLPIQFVYTLTPLIIYFFIIALEKNNLYQWIIFIFSYCVGIYYEIRIMYIVTLMLMFYFLFNHVRDFKKYIFNIIISGVLILGLNAFWIIPTIFGGLIATIGAITSRSLFGAQLFDMPHALTIFNWLWTGSKPNNVFVVQPVIWYFWLFPILSFSTFLFIRRFNNIERKKIIFFGLISLAGVLMTKQSAIPFPLLYEFLYHHLPGFSLFRESSKFFMLTAVGYLGLLSYLLLYLKRLKFRNKNYVFYILCIIIFILTMWNMKPLITGEIGGLFTARHISSDYIRLEKLIKKQNTYFRTLWIPNYSRWGFFDINHPIVSAVSEINTKWEKYILNEKNTNKHSQGKLMTILLSKPYADNLLDLHSIKYIIVPLEDNTNDDNVFIYYGKSRKFYVDELDKISYLQKVNIGVQEIDVYENFNFRPHIYITNNQESINNKLDPESNNLTYSLINPTRYTFSVKNIKKSFYLNFSENFNMGWRIRIGNFNWLDVLKNKDYFISDKYHFQNDANLNSYYINPTVVCSSHEALAKRDKMNDGCVKNSDGTYDISGTLYFAPQSYMYLGLIISGSTLIFVLCFLSFIFGKNIYERKNK